MSVENENKRKTNRNRKRRRANMLTFRVVQGWRTSHSFQSIFYIHTGRLGRLEASGTSAWYGTCVKFEGAPTSLSVRLDEGFAVGSNPSRGLTV